MNKIRHAAIYTGKKLHLNEKKIYLFLRTLVWMLGAFIVSGVISFLLGYHLRQVGGIIFIIVGYTGAIGGLGMGVLKLMRE